MSVTLVRPAPAVSRQFAELPANMPLATLRNHLSSLAGATLIRFADANDREDAFMAFRYHEHEFRIDERHKKFQLAIISSRYSEDTVFQVLKYFAWLLSPGLRE